VTQFESKSIRRKLKAVLLIVFLFFAINISYQFVKILLDKKSRLKTITSIPGEYTNLFFQSAQKITVAKSYVLYNTDISPISTFYYDDKYWVVITKLKIKKLDSLSFVSIKKGKPGLTNGEVYVGFDGGYYHLDILPDSHEFSKLNLITKGDSLKPFLKRKDLAAYYFNLKSIAISDSDRKRNYLKIETSGHEVQASLILLKRGQSAYFILIGNKDPVDRNETFQTNLNEIFGPIFDSISRVKMPLTYRKKNFDSLMNVVVKTFPPNGLDFSEGLLSSNAFVEIFEHSSIYFDDVTKLLTTERFNDLQASYCIYAMQNLTVTKYVELSRIYLRLYDEKKISEGMLNLLVTPNFLQKRIILENYTRADVEDILKTISKKNISIQFKETIKTILSGKYAKDLE
jgi:hypothetical protein